MRGILDRADPFSLHPHLSRGTVSQSKETKTEEEGRMEREREREKLGG